MQTQPMTSVPAHADSIPESSRRVAAVFDRAAPTYDSVGIPWFQPIADRLIAELQPEAGERALDLGCGRGAALFPLAAAVGPTGLVVGADLSTGMVEATRADVAARGLLNVSVQVMDVSTPTLEAESFDVLTASLVLFFLPDPAAALGRWQQLMVREGRIGVTTFGKPDESWEAVDEVFRPFLPQQLLDARTSGRSGPFSSHEAMEGLMQAAGFIEIHTVGFHLPVLFDTAEQWYAWTWSHGQRAMWEAVAERHDEVRDLAFARLESARRSDGKIELGQQVRITLARKG